MKNYTKIQSIPEFHLCNMNARRMKKAMRWIADRGMKYDLNTMCWEAQQ